MSAFTGRDSESRKNKSQQVIKITVTLQDKLTSLMLIKQNLKLLHSHYLIDC